MRAIGYTRVSADGHDLDGERSALIGFGVREDRLFVDYGLTGGRRDRPGLDDALSACRPEDVLVVTKLHRLAGSLADVREIGEELAVHNVRLMLDGQIHEPEDPVSRLMFRTLAALADFEAEVVRSRTREGLREARAKGRLRGKPPKLDPVAQARLVDLHHSESRSPEELAEMFGIARSTVYRVLERARRGAIQPVARSGDGPQRLGAPHPGSGARPPVPTGATPGRDPSPRGEGSLPDRMG